MEKYIDVVLILDSINCKFSWSRDQFRNISKFRGVNSILPYDF